MALPRVDTLFELYSIGRKFRSLAKQKNSDTMLTAAILRELGGEPRTISQLGQLVSMKPSSISEKVQQLLVAGLVHKKQATDEREYLISITDKGAKTLATLLQTLEKRARVRFNSVTDREMATLVTILKKITATL